MKKKRKQRHLTARSTPGPEPEVMQAPAAGPVRIGDIVIRKPVTLCDSNGSKPQAISGRVIYIHPKGRFHVVEFGEPPYTVRESFWGVRR